MKRLWLALILFAHATAYAQAPARGAFAGIGMHSADVEELNTRLAASGYPDFSDEFINFSVGYNWWTRGLVWSLDVSALFQPSESNTNYRTNLTGGYGLANVGVPVRAGRDLLFYPMLSVGAGFAQLSIQERADVSFDELLQDPGRTADVTNGSLLFGPRVGADYRWRRGERNGAARGFAVGVRASYLFSAFESEWAEIDNETVDGGPNLNMGGLQVMVTVGAWGERQPRAGR
ncbi:MAG TPA: outer membrane beta-barrel protein [Longimicrobiales bacterium]